MNILLCDDNPVFLPQLRTAIERHCALRDWSCNCKCFLHPEELLAEDTSWAHGVFLDIDMPEMNGLDVARQLRRRHPDLILVFVTGFIEYAPAGYDVSAFRYLLKTDLEDKLPRYLDDLWERLYVRQESIRVQRLDHAITVRLKDILYIEGTPHRHVLLHTLSSPDRPLECLGTLSDYETRLEGKGFLRIQKSFLANLWHIQDIRSYMALLDTGERLRVSRANYAKICQEYVLWEGQTL